MKVVLIGDSAVGKTTIVKAISRNSTKNTEPTINFAKSDVVIKASTGEDVTLCLWDTAGQETYQALAPLHARDSKVQILVFDVNDELTFTNLPRWYEILEEANSLDCIFIVGNKIDLPSENRQVNIDEASDYAAKINAKYNEVSALTGNGIDELFQQIADQLVEKNEDTADSNSDTKSVEVTKDKNKKDKGKEKGKKSNKC